MMRLRLRYLAVAGGLALAPFAASAQHGEPPAAPAHGAPVEGGHAAAAEGAHGGHGGDHATCTAQSSDHECFEYWEHHINWWSWDYKKGPTQQPEHRHMPPPLGFALINFAVFAYIMYRLAAGPLKDLVKARHNTIKKDLDEATALRRAAESKMKDYETKLAGLDAEIEILVKQLRAEAAMEKQRMVAAAEKQAEHIRRDAEEQIATELAQLRTRLRREVVQAAIAAAEAMVRDGLKPEDQRRLIERYLSGLETASIGKPTTNAPSNGGAA